jgi:LPS O-antigen subunit length determinant protein (WzzB/FepE family)
MKKNRSYSAEDIDLSEIINTFWSEKILILFISLIFMVVGYVYGALQSKIYKTELILRDAPSALFEVYRPYIGLQQQQQQQGTDIVKQFNDEFKLNLLSIDTLLQFFEKNNTINDFKNYLKEKNITSSNYFRERFEHVIDNKTIYLNKYSLTYSKPLPGEFFLEDYIIFVQQQTLDTFKQQLAEIILNQINIHQQQLEIAKIIGLENPIFKSTVKGRGEVNELEALYYNGTKVLAQKILHLNKLFNETKNLTLNYNPFLERASPSVLMTKSPTIFVILGLILGLFFSFIIIFAKKLLK